MCEGQPSPVFWVERPKRTTQHASGQVCEYTCREHGCVGTVREGDDLLQVWAASPSVWVCNKSKAEKDGTSQHAQTPGFLSSTQLPLPPLPWTTQLFSLSVGSTPVTLQKAFRSQNCIIDHSCSGASVFLDRAAAGVLMTL